MAEKMPMDSSYENWTHKWYPHKLWIITFYGTYPKIWFWWRLKATSMDSKMIRKQYYIIT
jgi:hypothetical protein